MAQRSRPYLAPAPMFPSAVHLACTAKQAESSCVNAHERWPNLYCATSLPLLHTHQLLYYLWLPIRGECCDGVSLHVSL